MDSGPWIPGPLSQIGLCTEHLQLICFNRDCRPSSIKRERKTQGKWTHLSLVSPFQSHARRSSRQTSWEKLHSEVSIVLRGACAGCIPVLSFSISFSTLLLRTGFSSEVTSFRENFASTNQVLKNVGIQLVYVGIPFVCSAEVETGRLARPQKSLSSLADLRREVHFSPFRKKCGSPLERVPLQDAAVSVCCVVLCRRPKLRACQPHTAR